MKRIAVICENFRAFRNDIHLTDLDLIHVTNTNDIRGIDWDGYIVWWDAYKSSTDVSELIYTLNLRKK